MTPPDRPAAPLRAFARLRRIERRHVAAVLRTETVGGALLIAFAIFGLLWANSPWRASYDTVKDTVIGPHLWHLDLSLANWAADFLLAFFFLVAGIELKHELQAGELSKIEITIALLDAIRNSLTLLDARTQTENALAALEDVTQSPLLVPGQLWSDSPQRSAAATVTP